MDRDLILENIAKRQLLEKGYHIASKRRGGCFFKKDILELNGKKYIISAFVRTNLDGKNVDIKDLRIIEIRNSKNDSNFRG